MPNFRIRIVSVKQQELRTRVENQLRTRENGSVGSFQHFCIHTLRRNKSTRTLQIGLFWEQPHFFFKAGKNTIPVHKNKKYVDSCFFSYIKLASLYSLEVKKGEGKNNLDFQSLTLLYLACLVET